jgi:hypothetical protein
VAGLAPKKRKAAKAQQEEESREPITVEEVEEAIKRAPIMAGLGLDAWRHRN